MNKTPYKHETAITISLIVIYILLNLLCSNLFGISNYKTTLLNLLLTIIIIIFIKKNNLTKYYGLTRITKIKEFIYFIPLIIIISINIWNGFNTNNNIKETIFYILTMLFVGFLEEIIFRGFLYKLLEHDNIKRAAIISSLTFGIGHIINLLNGANFIPTLIQIVHAISIGYLFVIIFQKGKSLWPCIITHSLVNALSIFCVDGIILTYIAPIFLLLISITYTIYIEKTIK